MVEFLINIDKKLFLFLNQYHSKFFDFVMWHISGKIEWVPLYLLILYYLIRKYRVKSIYFIVTLILLITIVDQLSVVLFKNTIQRLRPCHDPTIMHLVHIFNNHCGGMYGFISNHAANSFAFATYSSFLFNKKIFKVLIFIWALIVSYSRIYLGVHFPADIIGGAIFGIIVAYILWLLSNYLIKRISSCDANC